MAKKNRARDRESTEEREITKVPSTPTDVASASAVAPVASQNVKMESEAKNEPPAKSDSSLPTVITPPPTQPTSNAAAKGADTAKSSRASKKKSRLAANFGGAPV